LGRNDGHLFSFANSASNCFDQSLSLRKIIDGITQGEPIREIINLCLLSLLIFLLNDVVIHYYEDRLEIKKFDFDVRKTVAQKTLDKTFSTFYRSA